MTELLKGRISSVDHEAGMAKVVLTEHDNAVTPAIPFLCAEYAMPQVGELVYLLMQPGARLILGQAWSARNKPPGGVGVYYKALGAGASLTYHEETEQLTVSAPSLKLAEASGGASTLGELLARLAVIEKRLDDHARRLAAAEAKIEEHEGRMMALEAKQ